MILEKLYGAAAIGLGALLAAGVVYHVFEVHLLKNDIKDKASSITALTTRVDSLKGANVLLAETNRNFDATVKVQNAALQKIKVERDDADAKWKAADDTVAKNSITFANRIARILATQQAGAETWCEAWKGLVDGYYLDRAVR